MSRLPTEGRFEVGNPLQNLFEGGCRLAMKLNTLVLPGFGNSDPIHWQSRWESDNPDFVRVQQRDWDNPDREAWVAALEKCASQVAGELVLVAHSLGCLLVAHWAAQTQIPIKGALLVAPPDPGRADFPSQITGFKPFPTATFGFPSIVVASTNDPYANLEFVTACAKAWGSRLVNAGPAGHINSSSGLGAWPEGFSLYQQLCK
jgi:uncharacterized protein